MKIVPQDRLTGSHVRAIATLLVLAFALSTGCTGGYTLVRRDAGAFAPGGIAWLAPAVAADIAALENWRRSVGPPVLIRADEDVKPVLSEAGAAGRVEGSSDTLAIASWNIALGAGDVRAFVGDLRRSLPPGTPVILLLQEVYRAGGEVPSALPDAAGFADLIRGVRADGAREEVEVLADALDMHAYYVPSMRNGPPLVSDEDRGNAILSDLPLEDLAAIELPFERQRRVAVAATIRGRESTGRTWELRVVSAHLDNMMGARRLWIAGAEFARVRQVRGLLSSLPGSQPVVLGADLNTWFGFADAAYVEAAKRFPDTRTDDRRPTFRGLLRLDHLFYRLPDGWTASVRRAESRYGSDHHPLVATLAVR